jgi:hypothetical protein
MVAVALVMVLVPMCMIMSVIMPTMRVIVTMAVRMLRVGALLRIERRFHRRKPGAEPAQHVLDHMVAANAQPIADDLHVDMPVADVPGEPRQLVAVGSGNFGQRLRQADDAHNAAVVEHEAVAIMKGHRLLQVEQKGGAPLAGQNDSAATPLVSVEGNLIDCGGTVPVARRLDCTRAFHIAHKGCRGFIPAQFWYIRA